MGRNESSKLETDAEKQKILDEVQRTNRMTYEQANKLDYIPGNVPPFEVVPVRQRGCLYHNPKRRNHPFFPEISEEQHQRMFKAMRESIGKHKKKYNQK